MSDRSDRDRDDGRVWGHVENGVFWAIPKSPMINAGLGPPPFLVTLPDGRVRRIVHEPAPPKPDMVVPILPPVEG